MPTSAPRHKPSYARASRSQERRDYDRARQGDHNKTYDADWRRLRKAHLAANPLCVFCLDAGHLIAATVVDHIVAVRDAPDRRLDPTNIRSLCKPCHDRRTATEQSFHRR